MAMDLEDYLDGLLAKDEQAFQTVYEHTKHSVYAIIRSIVHDHSLTEDLMQDTYLRMMQKLNSYQRGRNFNAWLTQIAKNLAYDQLRRGKHEIHLDADSTPTLFESPSMPTESPIDFEGLLASLDQDERTIVMMKIVGDQPFSEIAKLVGKSVGSVHAIYTKAISKLTKLVGKE